MFVTVLYRNEARSSLNINRLERFPCAIGAALEMLVRFDPLWVKADLANSPSTLACSDGIRVQMAQFSRIVRRPGANSSKAQRRRCYSEYLRGLGRQ